MCVCVYIFFLFSFSFSKKYTTQPTCRSNMNQTLLGTRLGHLRFDDIQVMLRVGVNRDVLGFAKENLFGAVVAVACHDE